MSKQKNYKIVIFGLAFGVLIASCAPLTRDANDTGSNASSQSEADFRIITLLPKDAIPSIDNPRFYSASEADEEYAPEEIVLGIDFDGEKRAYSVNMLSSHEIVNDTIAGRPIAVTW